MVCFSSLTFVQDEQLVVPVALLYDRVALRACTEWAWGAVRFVRCVSGGVEQIRLR